MKTKAFAYKAALLSASLLSAAAWIPQAQALCDGLPETTNCNGPAGSCIGNSGNNLRACLGAAGCVMNGGGGNDIFFNAGVGPVLICGGSGNDLLAGGPAEDGLLGEPGNDAMVGFGDADFIDGGAGVDIAIGDGFTIVDPVVGDQCTAEAVHTCE